jgi:hypothetical protein
VNTTANFFVGQWIRVFINDATTNRRRRLLADADVPLAASGGRRLRATTSGSSSGVPAWVKADPIYQAAMTGLAMFADEEAGEHAAEGGGQVSASAADGTVTASTAAAGTIRAWLVSARVVRPVLGWPRLREVRGHGCAIQVVDTRLGCTTSPLQSCQLLLLC